MEIKFWGVRGSIPSPMSTEEYNLKIKNIISQVIDQKIDDKSQIDEFISQLPDDLRYVFGGNTTCVSVTSDSGKLYVIDCGTGIRELGYQLMSEEFGQGRGAVDIFLTHNHWDHIQGLPFFTPLYIPGNKITFYSPYPKQEALLGEQMRGPFFPADFKSTPATKQFIRLDAVKRTPVQLEDDLKVEFYPLKHPNGSYAYKFTQNGKVFIFATDAEFTGEILESVDNISGFFMDADLLIIDSQYTLNDSFLKIDWGHTSYTMAVNCGIRWKVKKLVMTHHEPAYPDEKLEENHQMALEHRKHSQSDTPEIYLAREGMTFAF